MSQELVPGPTVSHRRFAEYYERTAQGPAERTYMGPLRREIVGQARGMVLEVGAGNGLNFAFYDPKHVERVEATEPDKAMLDYARARAEAAPLPIVLTQAAVESLPFADASFDCVICTLVFCSVTDPLRGLREIRRVLKPEGSLFMVEHVRSLKSGTALMQDLITPFTRLFLGNCHWNRRTEQKLHEAGFQIVKAERRTPAGELLPLVVLQAS